MHRGRRATVQREAWIETVLEARRIVGGTHALARILGISERKMKYLITGHRIVHKNGKVIICRCKPNVHELRMLQEITGDIYL